MLSWFSKWFWRKMKISRGYHNRYGWNCVSTVNPTECSISCWTEVHWITITNLSTQYRYQDSSLVHIIIFQSIAFEKCVHSNLVFLFRNIDQKAKSLRFQLNIESLRSFINSSWGDKIILRGFLCGYTKDISGRSIAHV